VFLIILSPLWQWSPFITFTSSLSPSSALVSKCFTRAFLSTLIVYVLISFIKGTLRSFWRILNKHAGNELKEWEGWESNIYGMDWEIGQCISSQ
jgi:hypothetical protein